MKTKQMMVALTLVCVAVAAWGCDDKQGSAEALEAAQTAKLAEAAEAEEAPAEEVPAEAEVAEKEDAKKAGDELPGDLEAGKTEHYGAPFALDGEPMPLAAALAQAGENSGPYKVEATIEKVCKKKGCWFTLAAENVEIPIRVRMKDYGFFISRNTDGAKVILEGTLDKVTVPQEMAQHFADDAVEGTEKKAEQVEGDQETFQFMATGVEVTQPSA